MDTKQIKELISIVENSEVTEFEIEQDGCRIKIGKAAKSNHSKQEKDILLSAYKNDKTGAVVDQADKDDPTDVKGEKICSPMLGVFYAAPSPQKDPFVKVGDKVQKGDVLCIIEAMKIMNEITADRSGEISEICAENGQILEYGQTIFRMI